MRALNVAAGTVTLAMTAAATLAALHGPSPWVQLPFFAASAYAAIRCLFLQC